MDETGSIVGCIRCNLLKEGRAEGPLVEALQLDRIAAVLPGAGLSVTSHLAVAPKVRGRAVASQLIAAAGHLIVANEVHRTYPIAS